MRSAWLQCLGEVSATAVACSRLSDVTSPRQEDVLQKVRAHLLSSSHHSGLTASEREDLMAVARTEVDYDSSATRVTQMQLDDTFITTITSPLLGCVHHVSFNRRTRQST